MAFHDTYGMPIIALNPIRVYQLLVSSAEEGYKAGGLPGMWEHITWYRGMLESIGLNILLFMPLGYLLPGIIRMNWWKVLLIGFGFSILIKVMQTTTHLGWVDTSDLMHNTLGAVLGFVYYKLLEKHICSQS